ncbi:MAG TPA: AAA family ATPase [Anaerolineales bacterium]|nr:AAA family ATPase [Anaerolineales bacterium]
MPVTIALAGKGGTGKTTIAALLIRSLLQRGKRPLLAIDADPASNLNLALGVPLPTTVGQIREEMAETAQAGQLGVAISRLDYLTREVRMALEEGDDVDLLAMGRPEGQGCYCAVNHLLRQIIDTLGSKYACVVIDNEAGMEHISRRTTRDVDLLLLVTDPTVRGVKTAAAMAELAREVEVNVGQAMLILNRLQGEPSPQVQAAIDELGLPIAAFVPADPTVNELDARGEPLFSMNGDSPAFRAIETMTESISQTLSW